MQNKNGSQRLVGEVQMFRIRVATAESKLKLLREQHLLAKRRRKEAKRLAQRARKAYKEFKADLGELKQTLAKAETKLFQAGRRAQARKNAKARPAAKRAARPAKKTKPAASPARPALSRASRVTKRVVRKKPPTTIPETQTTPEIPVDVAAPDSTPATPPTSELNS